MVQCSQSHTLLRSEIFTLGLIGNDWHSDHSDQAVQWARTRNRLLTLQKFLKTKWYHYIIVNNINKNQVTNKLLAITPLWFQSSSDLEPLFTWWFGFKLKHIKASCDTKIKYWKFHFYNCQSKPRIHKFKNNKKKIKLFMHIFISTEAGEYHIRV